jgi:hypothetical protein
LTGGDERITSALSLGWASGDDVWQVRLDALNSTWQIPIFAYVEHKRSLLRVRASEARTTVRAIAAAAKAAHGASRYDWRHYTEERAERNAAERLCQSAIPVPTDVPKRTSYQPRVKHGQDYRTGDSKTGWLCLKFGLSHPQYYRYSYTAGGGYKGPARGGPDPGPSGFEAAAEGDLDGDGRTSLITVTGTVDPVTGRLEVAPTEFVADELE